MGYRGTLTPASKSLFLKHLEGSTQHETLLTVLPESLHMNTSTENIVCVHRVFLNNGFGTTHRWSWISGVPPSRRTKIVDPQV